MNAPFQVRQLAQYGRVDAAIPGTVTLMQMGEAGTPYASILTRDLVTSALAGGGNLNLAAGAGSIAFLFDQGAGAVTLSVVQGELQVSPSLRTSTLDATFVNAQSVTQAGIPVATQADLAADRCASVTSFNLRTGDVLLETPDILRAGGAPIRDAHFGGWITAPSVWDVRTNDDTVATTNWVHRAICSIPPLTTEDINEAFAEPGPPYPSSQTPPLGDASNRIATTLFVDESLSDYAPIYSPAFTGIPTAPTAPAGNSTTQLATTAFVEAAIVGSTAGVASFNGRNGAVVLSLADVTGAGGAPLASPALTGIPTAPTAAPGNLTTQLATTAFVGAAVASSGVSSFNARTGAVTLSLADVSSTGAFSNTALTGVPTAPTATAGTSTTQLATTAFVAAAVGSGAGGGPVTPQAGAASAVATGGTAVVSVVAVPAGLHGGYITNPQTASDQGIATAETLYVDIVGTAPLHGYGTTAALAPGQSFTFPAGMTTAASVNAVTSGHRFTAVWW